MTSKSKVPIAVSVLIWAILLVVVLMFPNILSIYGVLWILLPCLLMYVGFQAGTMFQSVLPKAAMVLISGVCEVITTLFFEVTLHKLYGFNIAYDYLLHFILGLTASSIGLLLSFLVSVVCNTYRKSKAERSQG